MQFHYLNKQKLKLVPRLEATWKSETNPWYFGDVVGVSRARTRQESNHVPSVIGVAQWSMQYVESRAVLPLVGRLSAGSG